MLESARQHLPRLLTVTLVLSACSASADLIIDTGSGDDFLPGYTLSPWQWLAGEVALDGAYRVTGIEGWIYEAGAGVITVAIYDDGGDVPGSNELFSATFTVDDPAGRSVWDGPHGLSWGLAQGTYWVAFEVREGSTFSGAMSWSSPYPLDHYAGHQIEGEGWNNNFGGQPNAMGFRVYATVVPEPSTLLLLGMAVVGLASRALPRWRAAKHYPGHASG